MPRELPDDHPDAPILRMLRDEILGRAGGAEALRTALPGVIAGAIELVIDPVRTARTTVAELDKVEKTFIGLKIEHYFRDYIDLPIGIRDLRLGGQDLDIKNTLGSSWMIPMETYEREEPCLLIASAAHDNTCSLGLLLARLAYLTKPNRDRKRGISAAGRANILWLVERAPLPASRWAGIDMARFRELRKMRGGARRAAAFFRENPGRRIHRSVVKALLFDQHDYMKRLRGNGGARDALKPEGILLLSGKYDAKQIAALGLAALTADEFVAVKGGRESGSET